MLTVYASHDSPRLRYVLRWMLEDCLGLEWNLTNDSAADAHLAYGDGRRAPVVIPDGGLLWQRGLPPGPPHFENVGVKDGRFHIDILSAAFYHLARCEEYAPFTPDKHGRFPHIESTLHKAGLIEKPVLDQWIELLRIALTNRCGLRIMKPSFRFQPTYDIDIAYAYHHKGFARTAGGILRDLKKGAVAAVRARLGVLGGRQKDPYDAYDFLRKLHAAHSLKPVTFFLAAAKPTARDKNISPKHPAFSALVQAAVVEGTVGLHPSYYSSETAALISTEKAAVEKAAGTSIEQSRQHFIRLRFTQTYRALLAAGIAHDWSMGFPDAPGFRAGTSRPFRWYDLEREEETALRIHPFCFMDVTARDYLGLAPDAAFGRLRALRAAVEEVGGMLTTVFHNFSLGTVKDWAGWREGYAAFVEETAQE